jgi:16S rRNA (adenine1518-N6/adenine1519-N6)-dimethyltransferase
MTASYGTARDIISKYGLKLKKGLGQNFLTDPRVLDKIIAAADISEADSVIEIGAGIGALTEALAEKAARVAAIEIDSALIPALEDILSGFGNITLINSDAARIDLGDLARELGGDVKVVANLPYGIAANTVMRVLAIEPRVKSAVVMVQSEVADRFAAKPGVKAYGALSVMAGFYAYITKVANVPRNCFIPRPAVDSAVIKFTPREAVAPAPPDNLFKVIKAGFSTRRKTIANCLSAAFSLPKAQIADTLNSCGIAPEIRGEALGLDDYTRLTRAIYDER